MKESDAASEMNQPLPQNYHPLVEKLRDDCLNYGESGIKGNNRRQNVHLNSINYLICVLFKALELYCCR